MNLCACIHYSGSNIRENTMQEQESVKRLTRRWPQGKGNSGKEVPTGARPCLGAETMKILITTDLFSTPTNGVVTSVKNLSEELEKRGHEVRILALSDSLESHGDGSVSYIKSVSLAFIYPDVRMPVSYRNSMISELIAWKPDVIHSQCEFFSFQFARHIAKETGAPLIHTYHTLYEQYVTYVIPSRRLGCRAVRVLSRKRLKHVDAVVAPTPKVERVLRSYGLSNPIRVVPSGISLEQYKGRPTEEERMQRRRMLGIPADHQVVLSLGRLGAEKNLEELVELFAQVLEFHPKLTFLIVGDGPDRPQLESLAAVLGIAGHVIFTGMVAPSEVQDYYQMGDVFVCASTSETQGLTYIEAAANGLPLLCRQDPCLKGVVDNGVNGYVYTIPSEFLEKMEAILSDADWRKTAGKRSEEIAKNFDKGHFAAAMEAVYESVLH